jgi:hypothetical protein
MYVDILNNESVLVRFTYVHILLHSLTSIVWASFNMSNRDLWLIFLKTSTKLLFLN